MAEYEPLVQRLGGKVIEIAQDSPHHMKSYCECGEGSLRYCINSAALRFVPLAEMQAQGYEYLLPLIGK